MENKRVYFIYKYTFPNGKVYIGQTFIGSRRFGRVTAYGKTLVRSAMTKYKTFEKEIIEYCSPENVDEREKFYIKLFNSTNIQFGYNLTTGGNKNKVLSTTVKRKISQLRKGTHLSQEVIEKLSKPVIQISKSDLTALNRYNSIVEASNMTGIDYSTISSVCRRKSSSAGGYYWCYEENYDSDFLPREIKSRAHIYTDEERKLLSIKYSGHGNPMFDVHRFKSDNPNSKSVAQYDLIGNYLTRFDCVKTACEFLKKAGAYSEICRCAKGKIKSSCGYIWRYEDCDVPVVPYHRTTTKGYRHSKQAKEKMSKARIGKIGGPRANPVSQYDLKGNFIKNFVSANYAEKSLGIANGKVLEVCKGNRKTAGGYIWKYSSNNSDQ